MIHLTEAPTGFVAHATLANRTNPDDGTLLLHLSMTDRRIGEIALTLLQALGKSLQVTGGNTVRTAEHTQYAPLWAVAHRLTEVLVLDAQRLTAAMVRHLRTLLGNDVRLVGYANPAPRPEYRRAITAEGVTTTTITWEDLLVAHPPTRPTGTTPRADGYSLDHLPLVDFLVFRDTARRLNTPATFAAIDTDYRTAYTAAATVNPDVHAVIAHLDQSTAATSSTAPILVAIRATQAALFRRGWLLQAHPDPAPRHPRMHPPPQPKPRRLERLRAYIRPERAATTTLYLLGTPAKALNSTTIGEARAALDTRTHTGRPVPDVARPLLTAQLLRREHEGAHDHDSYLNLPGQRRHLEILIDARRDLALPIDGRNLRDDHVTHSSRVLDRLGLNVRTLA